MPEVVVAVSGHLGKRGQIDVLVEVFKNEVFDVAERVGSGAERARALELDQKFAEQQIQLKVVVESLAQQLLLHAFDDLQELAGAVRIHAVMNVDNIAVVQGEADAEKLRSGVVRLAVIRVGADQAERVVGVFIFRAPDVRRAVAANVVDQLVAFVMMAQNLGVWLVNIEKMNSNWWANIGSTSLYRSLITISNKSIVAEHFHIVKMCKALTGLRKR